MNQKNLNYERNNIIHLFNQKKFDYEKNSDRKK